MKLSSSTTSHQRGIGLIEVLVSVLIFTFGITGLVKLQGALLKASSLAQSRSMAVKLAEAKIEDLRSFTTYDSSSASVFDFTSIASNSGGTLSATGGTGGTACNPTAPSYSLSLGNTLYSRNWCVSDYYFSGSPLAPINPVPSTTPPTLIAQKAVTVRIGWVDSDGTAQTLAYNVVINQNGNITGGELGAYTGGSGEVPTIPHTGSNDTRVTQISVGTSTKRETLVPGSTMIDGYVSTAFQSYVYNSNDELVRTEEFKNVACACAFDGISTDADQTRAPSYPKWSSEKGTYYDETGPLVTGKAKGCVDDNENGRCDSEESANPYCQLCCRDHHDVPSSISSIHRRVYDPYRVGDNNTDGTAKKYKGTINPVTSGTYYDACRLKRIGGYWRVYQDWNMVSLVAFPLEDFQDSTRKSTYADYVKQVVDNIIDAGATDGSSFTLPNLHTSLDHTTTNNRVSLTVGSSKESTVRSVYVDYIDSDFLTAIRSKKGTPGTDYLLHFPFYEIDTTSVAKWQSSSTASVSIVSSSADSIDSNVGRITGLANVSTPVSIAATLRLSNSGLTDMSSSVDYNATSHKDTDSLTSRYDVCIGCGSALTGASCTSAVGGTLLDGASRPVFSSSSSSNCNSVSGSILCTNGALSGNTDYLYSSCSNSGSTCTTTITASTNQLSDIVSATSGGSTVNCPYSSSVSGNGNQVLYYYACPGLTTTTGASISVTRNFTQGTSQTRTSTLTSNCGAQTVAF